MEFKATIIMKNQINLFLNGTKLLRKHVGICINVMEMSYSCHYIFLDIHIHYDCKFRNYFGKYRHFEELVDLNRNLWLWIDPIFSLLRFSRFFVVCFCTYNKRNNN